MDAETKKARQQLRPKKKPKVHRDYLSTGSTLLNLACANNPNGGFITGKYYFIVGDSTSGKTFLSLTCLAEASINSKFKDHKFIFDNNEDGALMDIEKFFGKEAARRMQPPQWAYAQSGPEVPVYSSTIEEFYFNLDNAIKKGRPFIYILDSMDSLSSQPEEDKFNERKAAHTKGKEAVGSYGDGKAKINAQYLRRVISKLRKSQSILIVINQTRDNMGFGFEKKTRSGGHSLKFYSTIEFWSSVVGKIKKTVKGKPRQIGVYCKIKIKKNRVTGKEREIIIPIYHSYGIADIDSCVDFLISEGHWKKKGNKINAVEFEIKYTYEKLIKYIENKGYEKDLRQIVTNVWNEIEDGCKVNRKKRYI